MPARGSSEGDHRPRVGQRVVAGRLAPRRSTRGAGAARGGAAPVGGCAGRPPVAQERLSLTPDGLVVVTLKAEWHDGTTHLLFTPVELLEKLAALTPRPRINLVL